MEAQFENCERQLEIIAKSYFKNPSKRFKQARTQEILIKSKERVEKDDRSSPDPEILSDLRKNLNAPILSHSTIHFD